MGKYSTLVEDHLILPLRVRLSAGPEYLLRRVGRPVPAAVSVRLLIDTGAKRTTLIPGIIDHLSPPGGDPVRLETPLTAGTTRLFWVRLDFPEGDLTPFEHVQVARLPMPAGLAQFHGLLGRDLLRSLESFLYEGRRGRYTVRDTPGPFGWLRSRL
jgi:hypothetical protein